MSRADAVVFVTRANAEDFAREYGPRLATRFHVVENGCEPSDFRGLAPRPASDRFVLLHAGSLYGARNPLPLLYAVAGLVASGAVDRHRIRIRLIGRTGATGSSLPSAAGRLGLGDVLEVVPHVARRQVLQEMTDASALLVIQPGTRLCVPGKLYEYLAAGRPILALAEQDSETAAIVRQAACGLVVSPQDQAGIQQALAWLIAAGDRVASSPPSLYDGTMRAAELEAILRTIAVRSRHVLGAASADAVSSARTVR